MAAEKCNATAEMVRNIVRDSGIKTDPYAEAYVQALDQAEQMYGCDGVKSQAAYIYGNLRPKTDKEKLAKQKLLDISRGIIPRTTLEIPPANTMSELELGNIGDSFENWSVEKHRILAGRGCPVGEYTLKDFEEFAEGHGYPVDKVLAANPWVEDCLTDEVKEAIKKAEKKVKILWE